jgi:hypothetical protein
LLNLHQNPKDPLDTVPPIEIVNSLDELLAKCDGVMIFSLDGRCGAGDWLRCVRWLVRGCSGG